MSIENADFNVPDFTLSPMILTDTLQTLIGNMIENIQLQKDSYEFISSTSETELNRMINELNTLQSLATLDTNALQETVDKIIRLESNNGDTDFIGLLRTLFTGLNNRRPSYVFRLPVTEAVDGKVLADISGYEFGSIDDYNVVVTVPTRDSGRLLTATAKKIDENTVEITIRDKDVFQGLGIGTSFFNPADEDITVDVVVTVLGLAESISGSVVDLQGETQEFGEVVTVYPSPLELSGVFTTPTAFSVTKTNVGEADEVTNLSLQFVTYLDGSNEPQDTLPTPIPNADGVTFEYETGRPDVMRFYLKGISTLYGVEQQEPADEVYISKGMSHLRDVTVTNVAYDLVNGKQYLALEDVGQVGESNAIVTVDGEVATHIDSLDVYEASTNTVNDTYNIQQAWGIYVPATISSGVLVDNLPKVFETSFDVLVQANPNQAPNVINDKVTILPLAAVPLDIVCKVEYFYPDGRDLDLEDELYIFTLDNSLPEKVIDILRPQTGETEIPTAKLSITAIDKSSNLYYQVLEQEFTPEFIAIDLGEAPMGGGMFQPPPFSI